MRKTFQSLKDTFSVVMFCLSMSFKSSKKYFLISNFITLITVFLPFINIYLFSRIIQLLSDGFNKHESADLNSFLFFVILLFAVSMLSKVLDNTKTYINGMHREIMQNHAGVVIMEKSAGLDVSFFDSSVFYNEMGDATRNSSYIVNTTFTIIDLIKSSVQLIIALGYMMSFSWVFALLLGISVIPHVIYQRKQLFELYNVQRDNMELSRRTSYSASIVQSRQHINEVRLYNLFPFILNKYMNLWKTLFRKKQKTSFKYTWILVVTSVFPEIITSLIIFTLGSNVFSGIHSIGDFSYYNGIAGQVLAAMFAFIYAYGQLGDEKNRLQNFIKFLGWKNRMNYDGTALVDKSRFTIEFCNVSFRYEPHLPLILKNVSFTINSPEKVALVGVNGSGKTTIIKLLLRFYDPTEGSILLNGIDIKNYSIEDYRKSFSTMFQDYSRYSFTAAESIALSDYDHMGDEERIAAAVRKSGADSVIGKLKNGVHTHLTRQFDKDGAELSGGEWQKIALARTFFHEPLLFILDEPSASLDAESEDELFKKFEELYADKGAILVSHRLSNVTGVDTVLVLDKGELIEEGSPNELLKRNGKFAHMFGLQAGRYNVKE